MKIYKKTFWGSLIAFIIGTSCCWITSLVIWVGGATAIGTIVSYIENNQILILSLGAVLLAISIFLYLKTKVRK